MDDGIAAPSVELGAACPRGRLKPTLERMRLSASRTFCATCLRVLEVGMFEATHNPVATAFCLGFFLCGYVAIKSKDEGIQQGAAFVALLSAAIGCVAMVVGWIFFLSKTLVEEDRLQTLKREHEAYSARLKEERETKRLELKAKKRLEDDDRKRRAEIAVAEYLRSEAKEVRRRARRKRKMRLEIAEAKNLAEELGIADCALERELKQIRKKYGESIGTRHQKNEEAAKEIADFLLGDTDAAEYWKSQEDTRI